MATKTDLISNVMARPVAKRWNPVKYNPYKTIKAIAFDAFESINPDLVFKDSLGRKYIEGRHLFTDLDVSMWVCRLPVLRHPPGVDYESWKNEYTHNTADAVFFPEMPSSLELDNGQTIQATSMSHGYARTHMIAYIFIE